MVEKMVDVHEKTAPGTALVVTSSSQAATTQLAEQLDASESHTMNYAVNESETTVIDETVTVSVEFHKDVDLLDRFLPLPPKAKCSDELQVSAFRTGILFFDSMKYQHFKTSAVSVHGHSGDTRI
ncbi:hypothetical protein CsSME_00031750 [Camellia sinensis var. sinensis]